MEVPDQTNKRFNEIASTELYDISGTGERIQTMAIDQRLVSAVYDEFIAGIEILIYSDASREQNFDTAKDRTIAIAAHLQHELGLSDEDTLKALELARLDIQDDE